MVNTSCKSGLSFEYILSRDSKPAHCFHAFELGKGYTNAGHIAETRKDYEVQLARERQSQLDNMGYAVGYAEPGYTDPAKGILFADWNCFSGKVSDILEQAGYAVEWQDEWTTCEDCNKAVRTIGNSYDWQPYYVELDGSIVCLDCVDWPSYLESIEDNPRIACMSACDPSEHGYTRISDKAEYESGFHPGMNDDPVKILKRYHEQGKTGLVFRLSETSQFYSTFEVWQKIQDEETSNNEEE